MVGFHRTFSMLLHLYKRLGVLAKHTPNRKKVKVSGQGLGALIPDAILLSGSTIKGVVDAKYKSLHPVSVKVVGTCVMRPLMLSLFVCPPFLSLD